LKNKILRITPYIVVFLLIVFFIGLFLFSSIKTIEIKECPKFIANYSDTFQIQSYIETNPNSIRSNYALLELNLFPDINSFRCIGKEINYFNPELGLTKVITTSSKIYEILLFNSLIFICILSMFVKTRVKLLFPFLLAIGYASLTFFFYKHFYFDINAIFFIFSLFSYFIYFSRFKIRKLGDLSTTLFVCVNFLLIYNYNIFSQLSAIFFLIYYFFISKKDLSTTEKNLFKFTPLIYYLLRQVASTGDLFNQLWERLSGGMYRSKARFVDLQYALDVLNCNFENCSDRILDNTRNNYGPIWEYLAIKINVEIVTIIIGILIILLTQYLYLKLFINNEKISIYLFFLYVSPPLAFEMERLNIDIFAILLSLYAVKIYRTNSTKSLLLLSFVSLIKIYPIFFFIGLALYDANKKIYSGFWKNLLFLIINSMIYVWYFIETNFTERLQNQSGISWSFGIVSDSTNIAKYSQYSNILNIFTIFVVSIVLFQYLMFKYGPKTFIFKSDQTDIEVTFVLTFLLTSIFSNIDFRLVIYAVPIFYILKNYEKNKVILLSFIFMNTSVSRYFSGFETVDIDFFFSFLLIFLNFIAFYGVYNLLLFEVLQFSRKINLRKLFSFKTLIT
jgi:hypothetical protein